MSLPAYKESPDLVRRIEAMERHFNSKEFINLYNIAEIEEKCLLPLPIENLQSDEKLLRDWPNIFEDLSTKSTLALACIALAMHNIIVKKQSTGKQETFQHHKIFTR